MRSTWVFFGLRNYIGACNGPSLGAPERKTTMRLKLASIVLAVLVMLVAAPLRSSAATCFCKVTANGTEVDKPSKGGFIQGIQTEACKNYCRGVWDSKSSADLLAWAKLLGKCGNISLQMDAAIGTAGYNEVRSTTVNVPCVPPSPQSCNLVQNGDFSAGIHAVGDGSMPASTVANWSEAFNSSPQLTAIAGCGGSPGYVRMWGNQVVGEAIQQTLSAPLVQGHTYKLSACVAWMNNNPTLPPYVRFRARLSNGPLQSYTSPGTLIGIFGSPNITATLWTTMVLPNWTAPANNLNTLTINPENAFTVNDGNYVSWGQIDNVCLQDLSAPCQAPNPDFTLTAVLPAGNSSTYQLTATTAPLAPGVGFWWQVEELNPTTGSVLPNTTVTNPAPWWANPTTNVFSGYNGTPTLGNTSNPGIFAQGHKYRISRGVWDTCHPFASISHTVFMSTP